jgi:1-acyl-sn-glycerol-3-phosphate acyltransferase
MRPPLRYRVLKQYVRLGLHVYFRKWESIHTYNIPAEGPFIFVANHQNAFLDALLVVCGIKRNPWFLARGDVFKKDWALRLLTFLRIKPVFRFRDGHAAMRKNDRIMNECVHLLNAGECILLFGEGDHNAPYTFRNLQKGFAHLALQYMEQTGKDISIIPVGFHYEVHDAFRSRVLVSYGEPISVMAITGNTPHFREKPGPLLQFIAARMKSLILTLPPDEDYPARKHFLIQNRTREKTMTEQLDADRKLMDIWKKSDVTTPAKDYSFYRWFNPLFLYGRITHSIPKAIMDYVVRKKIKDDQFIASVKFSLGIFLLPLYYLIIVSLFYILSDHGFWTFSFFLSLPISGLYAFRQD